MKYIYDLKNRLAIEQIYPIEHYWREDKINKELNLLDKTIKHIRKNKKVYKLLVFILAAFFLKGDVSFAETGIDRAGNKIYNKIISIAYWIILIKGTFKIIGCVLEGDLQGAKRTFFTYIMIYGTLFALPWGLKQVREVFSDF